MAARCVHRLITWGATRAGFLWSMFCIFDIKLFCFVVPICDF